MFSYDLWDFIAFFMIYCLIGWAMESLYVSFEHKKWVNRGFLHGPFLPIYGFGAIIILISTIPVRNHYFLIFLFGMIGATLLEYVTGYVMERIFHVKYWDYSYDFCNLNGYICLGCSLAWGVCSLLLTGLIHNPIEKFVFGFPHVPLIVIDLVFVVYFIWDVITSAQEAFDLKKMILENEEIKRIQKRLDVIAAFAEEDKEKMRKRASRILRRNPGSVSLRHKEELESIKEYLASLKNK